MSPIIPSDLLKAAAAASERWEKAEAAMHQQWPEPPRDTIDEWNEARRQAEELSRAVRGRYR